MWHHIRQTNAFSLNNTWPLTLRFGFPKVSKKGCWVFNTTVLGPQICLKETPSFNFWVGHFVPNHWAPHSISGPNSKKHNFGHTHHILGPFSKGFHRFLYPNPYRTLPHAHPILCFLLVWAPFLALPYSSFSNFSEGGPSLCFVGPTLFWICP